MASNQAGEGNRWGWYAERINRRIIRRGKRIKGQEKEKERGPQGSVTEQAME